VRSTQLELYDTSRSISGWSSFLSLSPLIYEKWDLSPWSRVRFLTLYFIKMFLLVPVWLLLDWRNIYNRVLFFLVSFLIIRGFIINSFMGQREKTFWWELYQWPVWSSGSRADGWDCGHKNYCMGLDLFTSHSIEFMKERIHEIPTIIYVSELHLTRLADVLVIPSYSHLPPSNVCSFHHSHLVWIKNRKPRESNRKPCLGRTTER